MLTKKINQLLKKKDLNNNNKNTNLENKDLLSLRKNRNKENNNEFKETINNDQLQEQQIKINKMENEVSIKLNDN